MKIVHATWENRNLGRDAYEITLNRADLRSLELTLEKIHAQDFSGAYVVIKMPVGDLRALHMLEDDGFRFIEMQLHLVQYFEPHEDNCVIDGARHTKWIKVAKNREDWERVIQKITPEMFEKDRISLDPLLGNEMACHRYQNWCRDLYDDPMSELQVFKVNGEEVCFELNVYDSKNSVYNKVLGGVFADFKQQGYGALPSLQERIPKISKVKTVVSSNNLAMLRIHQFYGKIVTSGCYVLRKIYDLEK